MCCLDSLGFSVTELIIPLLDKSVIPEIDAPCPITVLTTAKATAKKIISASKEEGFVLLTAPDTMSDKLREEILRILNF